MLKEIHAKYTFAEIILISKWFSEKAKNQTGFSISTAVKQLYSQSRNKASGF
jgi:hypothetical protein